MFAGANGVYGDVKINGIPLCDETIQNGFARNTNVDHGALYLVPDDAAYTWAEREEAKYGLHGSITQGHVYLRKLFDFTVSESIVFTGDGGTDLTAGDLTVKNLGTGQIHVSRIELGEISDDWSITAWGTNFAILPKDSKKLSLSVAGVDLSECAYQQEEFLVSGQQKTFSINGKTGVVSCPLRQAYIASLLVTVRTM